MLFTVLSTGGFQKNLRLFWFLRCNSWTFIEQKTRIFWSMLFTVFLSDANPWYFGVHSDPNPDPQYTRVENQKLGQQFHKRLECFAQCYSQSFLLVDFKKTTVYSEMQFLDIYWTKDSNLLIYAIHSLSQWCKSMIFGVDPDPDPRNRIRGSMPLTNGSGFGSGSVYFHHWPSRCQQKLNFLGVFSEYYFLTVLLNHLSKVKSQKEVTNQYIKGLSYYFC
jgi:hypothetical protein